jgi:TetR/AcrR family transcriptional regulator, transcriptional repressor for nem operon
VRISREKVAENRELLIQVAADQFREHGIDGVGVADLMKKAGMSLGSFYGYFDSKEQLVAECCAHAIAETREKMTIALSRPLQKAMERIVDEYLSIQHRDNRSKGCVLAALGSEIAHKPGMVHRRQPLSLPSSLRKWLALFPVALARKSGSSRLRSWPV